MISIGTSGYTYSWNKGGPNKFKWYIEQGFNSVEVNGSFYRFPTSSWVTKWRHNLPKGFIFSIKVHRAITHYSRLGEKSISLWNRFKKPLVRMEENIGYWLLQMPSNFTYTMENINKIKNFERNARLGDKAVLEFRDPSWWCKKAVEELKAIGIAFCSVDAPELPKTLVTINETLYLRLHGSTEWYNYVYSEKELDNILTKIRKRKANRNAIYLNNDHGMLKNGMYLLSHSYQLVSETSN
jgi:uncharacterized protein YecE (DUF72 family)